MDQTDLKRIGNIGEACNILQISRSHMYQLVRERKVPYYKVGRKLIFDLDEIKELLLSSRKATIKEIETQK